MTTTINLRGPRWWYAVLALVIALSLWMMMTGCATCPPADVIVRPVEVLVPVPVTGEQLVICHAPTLKICDQPTIGEKVTCIGENVLRWVACHESNIGEMEAHNRAVTVP